MKKNYFLLVAVAIASITMNAQTPTIVSTVPSNKNVVLEEFTGIHCGYCPDGHEIARNLEIANPTRFFAVNIHSGGYANPSTSTEPDLRTTEGNALDAYAGVAGYPEGMVQRVKYAGQLDIDRGAWSSLTTGHLAEASYANVGVTSMIDTLDGHNDLLVHVQVYYTADMSDTVNYLTVALTQDSIVSTQSNYGSPPYNPGQIRADGKYIHLNVLRKMLSPTWGIRIGNWMTVGVLFDTTFTFPIPATISAPTTSAGIRDIPFLAKNTHAVAYISAGKEVIITANHSEGEPSYRVRATGIESITDNDVSVSVYPNPLADKAMIEFNTKKSYNNTSASIYDASGALVFNTNIGTVSEGNHSFQINANDYSNGIYFVRLVSNGTTLATKSFIKN